MNISGEYNFSAHCSDKELADFWDVIEHGFFQSRSGDTSFASSLSSNSSLSSAHDHDLHHDLSTPKKACKSGKLLKKHYRPKNWRNIHPFPRIFKSDIRRDMPFILINGINYHDPSMLLQMVRTFCVPSLAYKTHDVELQDNVAQGEFVYNEFGDTRSFDGAECMVKRAWLLFAEAPDLTVHLQGNPQLCQSNQYSETKIVLDVVMKGHNAYKMSRNIEDICPDYLLTPPQDYQDLILIGGRARSRIIPFQLECQLIIYVDSYNRVNRFHFVPHLLQTNTY